MGAVLVSRPLLGTDGPQEDVAARLPLCAGRGAFQAGDGIMDVAGLLLAFLRGADVRYRTTVSAVDVRDDGVRVETDSGPIDADVLVNAAGAWAGTLFDLPAQPTNRHLFVSEPDPSIDPDWPYLWDVDAGYYVRPESGGLLLSACDETPAPAGEPSGVDAAVVEALAEKLRVHQPTLSGLHIAHGWVGQRTFVPDRLPVVGFDAATRRVFHVAALGGHGVTLSDGIGRLAARLLLGGGADGLLSPARFARAPR